MPNQYPIKEISKITGFSLHTLRYYEKIGLTRLIKRDSSGYRTYTEQDITWFKFINRLRTTGMPIKEMIKFASLYSEGDPSIPMRRLILEQHRDRVIQNINELSNNLEAIEAKIIHFQAKEKKINNQTSA